MKLDDIKEGMTLKAVGDYGDLDKPCFVAGNTYVVEGKEGLLVVQCGYGGDHVLDGMEDDNGNIPELEPA